MPVTANAKLSALPRDIEADQLDPDQAFAPLLHIIEQAQARAYRAVNRELLGMYWDIGVYISAKVADERWGQSVVT